MELQALLLSNNIPNDIVINEIYNHLWRNKNVLNEKQKRSLLCTIIFISKKLFGLISMIISLSKNKESMDYFLG